MKRSKKKQLIVHAKNRAALRFGLDLSLDDLRNIVNLIQKKEGTFIERQSNRVTVWDIVYAEKTLRVVYDTNRKAVITFLDPEGSIFERIDRGIFET